MDIYHIWCELVQGADDLAFAKAVDAWLGHLRQAGAIESFRLTRRKLGLGPDGLGDWHVMIETNDMAQLDHAFNLAATRAAPAEPLHAAVYKLAKNPKFALYRDFPDPVRTT